MANEVWLERGSETTGQMLTLTACGDFPWYYNMISITRDLFCLSQATLILIKVGTFSRYTFLLYSLTLHTY